MKDVYVVTGGSGGIGMAIAKSLKDGKVLISGLRNEELENAKSELISAGIDAEIAVCDVTDRKSVVELAEKAKSLGKFKGVVNCAGVSGAEAGLELVYKVDLQGTALIMEEFHKIAEKGSVGIMIASMMGHTVPESEESDRILSTPLEEGNYEEFKKLAGDDSNIAYNLSKRGVIILCSKDSEKWGEKGARIISVSPGIIMTPMALQAAKEYPERMKYLESITPAKRNGEPEDIANVVSFLLSDKADFITGTDILVDGGLAKNIKNLG